MLEPLTQEQKSWRWRILISTYFAYAGYYLTRKAFTICKTTIGEEFDWDLSQVAHIWTAFLIAYAIGQFANSFLGRRHGPRVLLLGGLGLSICFNAAFGFVNSYETFLLLMFANGLAQASGWPGAVGGISEWLRPAERGTIMGFWSTSYLIGNMSVKFVGGLLLASYGWRYAFFGLSLLTFFVWWLVYFWQRNRPEDIGLDPIVGARQADTRAIRANEDALIPWQAYLRLAMNPVVIAMGTSYFCIKFLRYALDSWLPAFLNIQGMDVGTASYFSAIFDWAGLGGAVVAGLVLDRVFRGNWAALCFVMGLGMIAGYLSVIYLGTSPQAIAICFGLVGFMIYGPDTILAGAASVSVAGERNGVAVAGLVNGIASIGPIFQEEIIGYLMRGDEQAGIRNTNWLALTMSITFTLLMIVMMWRLHTAHAGHRKSDAQSMGT
ncbi:MAG: MFS transporter [Candidatus Hydrogenedentes bacterium]|nr:MFS transporter [Candidatus Hydrogenedentota bacterium]